MFKLFLFLIVCLVCINAGNVYPSPDAGQLSKLYQSEVAEIEHGESFTIPQGTDQVVVEVRTDEKDRSLSFRIAVEVNDVIKVERSGDCDESLKSVRVTQTSATTQAVINIAYFNYAYDLGNGLFNIVDDASATCSSSTFDTRGSSYYVHDQAVDVVYSQEDNGNDKVVSIAYTNTCPLGYTLVKTDFNPILLGSSTLKKVDNQPKLQLDFRLPIYYHGVVPSFPGQCEASAIVTTTESVGCEVFYYNVIDYTSCDFELIVDPNNAEQYIYRGKLQVDAKVSMEVDIAGNTLLVERTVQSPVNWQVKLARTIEVTTDAEIENPHHCSDDFTSGDHACNNNGCCTDGYCDCACTEEANGYTGKYCEIDIEPPVCNVTQSTLDVGSPHGGCIKLWDEIQGLLPDFTDNSGTRYVKSFIKYTDGSISTPIDISNGDITYLKNICFALGTHEFIFTVSEIPFTSFTAGEILGTYDTSGDADPSDPVDGDDYVQCSFSITVLDAAAPFVDCHQCNSLDDQVKLCKANKDTNNYGSPFLVAQSDLQDYFNDIYFQSYDVWFAGSKISNNDDYDFIDCDCNLENREVPAFITNTWNSWGTIRAYDVTDPNLNRNTLSDPGSDGVYPLLYTATDDDGLSGTCNIGVTYDITAPTCEDFIHEVQRDDDNKNYSLPVDFSPPTTDFDISGHAQGPVLTPSRSSGDYYWVGYDYNATYNSIWWLVDQAGNNGSCDWQVTVQNPTPCLWPVCDDAPPYKVTCPSASETKLCNHNNDCGCGNWVVPTFKDDKFVQFITVQINGTIVEEYNNDQTSSAPSYELDLGEHKINYTAYDMHNQSVSCEFSIIIEDRTAPALNGCPANKVFSTVLNDTTIEFDYGFGASDSCTLNEDIYWAGGLSPDTSGTDPSDVQNNTLETGEYTYEWSVQDDSGNVNVCQFNVSVLDGGDPNLACPPADGFTNRIPQEQVDMYASFHFEAEDAVDGNLKDSVVIKKNGVVWDPLTEKLVEGSYVITLYVEDAAGNSDQCAFNIEVLEPYPLGTMSPALVDVDVREFSNVNGEPIFGAEMDFVTLSNRYHRVTNVDADQPLPDNHNDNIDTNYLIQETPGRSDCAEETAVCWQYFKFYASFDDCEIDLQKYDVTAYQECRPADCPEEKEYSFRISLTAANYCWMNLANVRVEGELIMVSNTTLITFEDAWNLDANTAFPVSATSFHNDDEIVGIVSVDADVILTNVEIIAASKEYHADNSYNNTVQKIDLSAATKVSYASWAYFKYIEKDVPLETVYYTRFEATALLTYDLGVAQSRRLLALKADRQLLQENDFSDTYQANVLMTGTPRQVKYTPAEAVVKMELTDCQTFSSEWERDVQVSLATYLRISPSRIIVELNKGNDNQCYIEAAFRPSDCDGLDMLTLLDELEIGVKDRFSELHTLIFRSDFIPTTSHLNTNVFYIEQIPTEEQIVEALAAASEEEVFGVALAGNWYVYVIAGMALGFMVSFIVLSKSTGNKKSAIPSNSSNINNLLKSRRYSIGDLTSHTNTFHHAI